MKPFCPTVIIDYGYEIFDDFQCKIVSGKPSVVSVSVLDSRLLVLNACNTSALIEWIFKKL